MKREFIVTLIGLVVLSGCVVTNGTFKYKGTRVEIESVDLEGVEIHARCQLAAIERHGLSAGRQRLAS